MACGNQAIHPAGAVKVLRLPGRTPMARRLLFSIAAFGFLLIPLGTVRAQ